jgi:hypothetical protein
MLNQPQPSQKQSLEFKIQRINRQIDRYEGISRTYSWVRLSVFFAGIALTWGTAALLGTIAGGVVFVLALFAFSGVVILHRRTDHWIARLHILRDLYAEQLARLTLDWKHIPPPITTSVSPSPLEVDLDLTGPQSLHQLLDRSISRQGSSRLIEWLSSSVPDCEKIVSRQAVVQELKKLPRFCSRFLLTFRELSSQPFNDNNLLDWLKLPAPKTAFRRVLPLGTLLAFGNIVLFGLNVMGILPAFWLLTSLAYIGLYFTNQAGLSEYMEAVVRLDRELDTFQPLLIFLENYPYGKANHLANLCTFYTQSASRPSLILRRVKWATSTVGLRMNLVIGLLLNLLTPWDFWAAWLAARQKERLSLLLPVWLEAFHELEALISLGMFAAQNPDFAFPQITSMEWSPRDGSKILKSSSTALFEAQQMGHPLIPPDRRVCNDFTSPGLNILNLITGSNMAGKSTFIRTIGVNLCLAYAGGPVCASAFKTAPFRLYTCIRINDSLGEGFSYFYAEVKRLKGLLEATRLLKPPDGGSGITTTELPLLYLIDEIFRGTNNRERFTGSKAYIKKLVEAPALGFIATHDLELAKLADSHPQIHNFHFSDEVVGGTLSFDYKIRPGASTTTNALKIMEMEGLPTE